MSDEGRNTPLFPLATVLLPNGPMMLRIFEPRYLDMISRSLRDDSGFVVVLLKQGAETGATTFYDIGTLAKIVDWHQYEDGVLGVTVIGQGRAHIQARSCQADGLNVGAVEMLPSEPELALPCEYDYMARLLRRLLDELGRHYEFVAHNFSSASWVAFRLAEILPLPNAQKQACLELTRPRKRLELVASAIKEITHKDY